MSGFSELIKNFDKTRDYVRDFFIYGFKGRNDFSRKSSRTYDDEKRRAESWLAGCLRHDDSAQGRTISVSVDSAHISENPLYRAYYSKSFTDNDIKLHFMIQDVLYDSGELTLREIAYAIDERFGVIFDPQTIRTKLKEYVREGIIICEKKGRSDYFRLSDDTAEELFSRFKGLIDAVKFFSETYEYGIVGNTLLKAVGAKNDLFFIKHNYIVHTLEDVILPEIIEAIDEKCYVTLRTFSTKFKASGSKEPREFLAVPLKILCSVQTGRRWLLGYIPKYHRYNAFRLDYMHTIKKGGNCADFDSLLKNAEANLDHVFGVSFGSRRDNGNVEPVKIIISADEENEAYIIERLEREKRCGKIEHIGENLYAVTFDIFDPSEIMQWVKSFIGRIVRIEGGTESLRRKFVGDINRMYNLYCKEG